MNIQISPEYFVEEAENSEISLFIEAIKTTPFDIRKFEENLVDLNKKSDRGLTALHYAVVHGNLEAVNHLCHRGVAINAANDEGNTPLHLAFIYYNDAIIGFLIKNGANIEIKNKRNQTPFDLLPEKKSRCFLKIFHTYKTSKDKTIKDLTKLHLLIDTKSLYHNMVQAIDYIETDFEKLEEDETVKFRDDSYTLLISRFHADFNDKVSNAIPLYHATIRKKNKKFIDYLTRHKFRSDTIDEKSLTPLDYALRYSFDSTFKIMQNEITMGPHNFYVPFHIFNSLSSFLKKKNSISYPKFAKVPTILTKLSEILYFYDLLCKNINYDNDPINAIIYECFNENFLCKFDVHNPHLRFCTVKLPNDHYACLRCVLKLKCDYKYVHCISDHCHQKWKLEECRFYQLAGMPKRIILNEHSSNDNIRNIMCGSIEALRKSINYVLEAKEGYNNTHETDVFDMFSFIDDSLDLKIECIKMEIEKLEKKMLKILKVTKQAVRKRNKIDFAEIAFKAFKTLNQPSIKKTIEMENVGITRVQLSFMNQDYYLWNCINELEKATYLGHLAGSVSEHRELYDVIDINYDRSIGDINTIKDYIQYENIIQDLGHVARDFTKLDDSFKRVDTYRHQVNLLLDLKVLSKSSYVYHSDYLQNVISRLDACSRRSSSSKEEVFNILSEFSMDKYPNHAERRAFEIIKNGTLDELKEIHEMDKNLRLYHRIELQTMLLAAICANKTAMVEYLLGKADYITIYYRETISIAEYAYQQNCDEELIRVLDRGGFHDVINCKVKRPLMDDFDEMNEFFIKNFKKPDLTDRNNEPFCFFKQFLLCGSNIEVLEHFFDHYLVHTDFICNSNFILNIGGSTHEVMANKVEFIIKKCRLFTHSSTEDILIKIAKHFDWNPINDELLEYMIGRGLELDYKEEKTNSTVFHIGAMNGNLELLKLVSKRWIVVSDRDSSGYTPIMHAIENGHLEVVKWMIEFYESFELVNGVSKLTFLDFAISNGQYEISKLLKQIGVEMHLQKYFKSIVKISKINQVALTLYFNGHNIVKLSRISMLNKQVLTEKLLVNCFKNCPIKMLQEFDIPFDHYKDDFGASAVHVSAAFGRSDLILWLFMNKFNMEATDKAGYHALQYAALNYNMSTVLLLNILGYRKMYKYGTMPLLYYYTQLRGTGYDPTVLREELHMSIESYKFSYRSMSLETIENLGKMLQDCLSKLIVLGVVNS